MAHYRGLHVEGMVKWAQKNPQEAAAAILENAAGSGTEYCMEAVAEVWAKSDPAGALAFATDAKGKEGAILRETVFQQWLGKDMAAASDWLTAQNDPQLDDFYRPMVIEEWAKEDPQEALAWCEEHLTGVELGESLTKLVEGMAKVDIESAAHLVGELEPGRAQQKAAVAVAQKWFPSHYGASEIPAKAIDWLRNIEDVEMKEEILRIGWDTRGLMLIWRDSGTSYLRSATSHSLVVPFRIF